MMESDLKLMKKEILKDKGYTTMNVMNKKDKIYIAGHKGMVGSAYLNILQNTSYCNLIGKPSKILDLRSQKQVSNFFKKKT